MSPSTPGERVRAPEKARSPKQRPRPHGCPCWAGKVGEAQIGPIYLGVLGSASIVFGVLWFWIVGFSMLSSVNWNIIEMIRQLPWLALEPPPPEYGLRMPPLHKGGWWVIASFFLLLSVLLWWARTYVRARALGMGTHVAWAFASAIWLFLVLGLFRPVLMG
ncbi:MAG: photosynthetic reaction center subunit M, partial [Betaproteobacteria bacterium]|nr:photosynthetic reaction center subunit M [Betaproteobacteria bacterium]